MKDFTSSDKDLWGSIGTRADTPGTSYSALAFKTKPTGKDNTGTNGNTGKLGWLAASRVRHDIARDHPVRTGQEVQPSRDFERLHGAVTRTQILNRVRKGDYEAKPQEELPNTVNASDRRPRTAVTDANGRLLMLSAAGRRGMQPRRIEVPTAARVLLTPTPVGRMTPEYTAGLQELKRQSKQGSQRIDNKPLTIYTNGEEYCWSDTANMYIPATPGVTVDESVTKDLTAGTKDILNMLHDDASTDKNGSSDEEDE
jgi:hypothetical protein